MTQIMRCFLMTALLVAQPTSANIRGAVHARISYGECTSHLCRGTDQFNLVVSNGAAYTDIANRTNTPIDDLGGTEGQKGCKELYDLSGSTTMITCDRKRTTGCGLGYTGCSTAQATESCSCKEVTMTTNDGREDF